MSQKVAYRRMMTSFDKMNACAAAMQDASPTVKNRDKMWLAYCKAVATYTVAHTNYIHAGITEKKAQLAR